MSFVFPFAAVVEIVNVQTAANGAEWVQLPEIGCVAVDIVNNTGTEIEYRRGAGSAAMPIRDGQARLVFVGRDAGQVIGMASRISVRRADQLNTQVTLTAEALSP